MLRIIALVQKQEDMAHDEFEDYWYNTHVPIVNELPQLRKYVTGVPIKPDEAPYDGIAELYFDSTDDIKEAFESEIGERIMKDEHEFLKDGSPLTWVVDRTVQHDEIGD